MRTLGIFLWEQWRQTYKSLAAVSLTVVLYGVIAWRFKELLYFVFSKNEVLAAGTAYLPVVGAAVLLFIQESRGRIGFAYPRRMMVLPVHTFTLVAVPLIYRVAIVGIFAYASSWICDTFLREVFFKGPQVLLLMTSAAAAQAFVFLTCGYGAATGTALFAGAFVVTTPGLRMLLQSIADNMAIPSEIDRFTIIPNIGYGGVPVAGAMMLFWFVVAYQGARYARSEVAEDPVGGLVRVLTRLTYFDREREEFASAEAAQQWLEWRRGAYLFPWLSLGLAIALTITFRVAASQLENRFVLLLNVLAIAPAIVASLVGYTVTRSGPDYQWFVGARPLTTAAIARARMRAGVRAVFWAYALLVVTFLIAFKLSYPHAPIMDSIVRDLHVVTSTEGGMGEGVALLAVVSGATMLAVWSLFWMARASGVLVWAAGVVVAIWYYMQGGLYVVDKSTGLYTTPDTVFLTAMSALVGVTAVAALIVALVRGYVGARTLLMGALAWIVLMAVAIWANNLLRFGGPLMAASWLLLPLVPVASIPLSLEWQRHR